MENGQQIAIDKNTCLRICLPVDESDEETEVYSENKATSDSEGPAEWSDAPTKLLIELYKKKKVLVEERKLKSMKHVWQTIMGEIKSFGYNYTAAQCENKWKSLERAFKKKISHDNKTGRGRRNCPYERELSNILLKRASVIPPVVMDAVKVSHKDDLLRKLDLGTNDDAVTEIDQNSLYSSASASSPSSSKAEKPQTQSTGYLKKKPQQNRSLVVKELTKLRETIDEHNKQKQNNEKKKCEQRERMISELKRRNDLFEQFLTV